jgi:hypothetical protein
MKKVVTTLVIVAALFAGSVSFAGLGPKTGGGRTTTSSSSLNCTTTTVSSLECTTTTVAWE